jgi:two-component system chemotaxis sensor kinase CheA
VPPDLIDTFLQEADDLLAEVEETALRMDMEHPDAELVHRLFRAFHTIKGSGGLVGLTEVAAFTHHVETLLDAVREGALPVTLELVTIVLASKDQIRGMLDARQSGGALPDGDSLIAQIRDLSLASVPAAAGTDHMPALSGPALKDAQAWKIRFKPAPNLLASGGNPLLLFRDLQKLGACEIKGHTEEVPPLDRLTPENCYLWWTITLRGRTDENAIRDVFLFVEDGSELEIAAVEEEKEKQATPDIGPIDPRGKIKDSMVRVPTSRLDRLVGLVGELVMNHSRLSQAAALVGAPELAAPVEEIERLVSELRDSVLGIRMMPIGSVLGRFRRLVHDLSAELGKEVDLLAEGEETEIDKSVLDQLGDPLVHIFRNAIDHGIETPAVRLKNGKSRRGTIRLVAMHVGSDVAVSIEDDGRGLDREAILAKALEKRLVAPGVALSDRDVFNLILLPGFSTARSVTNVSGRGVGMDVVKRQIETLRGRLGMSGETGKGTKVTLKLPLTLAIIDGLVVQLDRDRLIVPMTAVTETVELLRETRSRNNGRNVIAVRGELIPYIDLRETFASEGDHPDISKIVIVNHEEQRVGLLVDRVLGTHQTVIQPLGRFLKKIKVASGSTVMGDGRVALILDVGAVVRLADQGAHLAGSVN